MKSYFQRLLKILNHSLMSLDDDKFTKLIDDCEATLRNGGKIITSGLGKNVPVCEKFVGTMNSLGQEAYYMNTNSAVHGDIGIVKEGDVLTEEYIQKLDKEAKDTAWLCDDEVYEKLSYRAVVSA